MKEGEQGGGNRTFNPSEIVSLPRSSLMTINTVINSLITDH